MTSTWAGLAGALLGGLCVYGLFHWVLWDVPMSSLSSLIGLAALIGGGVGSWLARRRAAPPAAADPARSRDQPAGAADSAKPSDAHTAPGPPSAPTEPRAQTPSAAGVEPPAKPRSPS